MAAKGWLSGRNLKWVSLILAVCLMPLLLVTDDNVTTGDLTYVTKVIRSLQEISISNYENFNDIALNWRGFETFKTFQQYWSGTTFQLFIGQGFGALTDLGFYMGLGGDASVEFRYIPVMHNGYGYILLKYGFLGFLLYITFYVKLISISLRHHNSNAPQIAFYARFLLGLTLALACVMIVGGGMAELVNSEYVILTGVLFNKISHEVRSMGHQTYIYPRGNYTK
jgi:hypothetical protein